MTSRPLPISLDRNQPSPVYRQIYERIRNAILAGTLAPGTRLPSWNGLASQLGVARGTVKAAYDWLAGEGYVLGCGAAGTIVPPIFRTPRRGPDKRRVTPRGGHRRNLRRASPPPVADADAPVSGRVAPFQMGFPALDAFPRKLWTRVAAQCVRRFDDTAAGYTDIMGYRRLRESIAAYVAVSRGIACTADQVFITCGYSGALELICRTLLEAGDRVWIEDPAFFRTLALLQLTGVRIVPVPVDEEGLRVSAGTGLAPDARFAVVTPSHQAPLGMSLSLPRRLELLDWAVRRKRWIVEDDYYGEFNLTAHPMSALSSLDEAGRVLYAGTFSKTLLPSLRLGYLIIPVQEVERFRRAAHALLPAPPALVQHTVCEFMHQGHFGRHMQRMRRLYAERKQSLIAALETQFGAALRLDRTGTGLHLVAHLRAGTDDAALARAAHVAGLGPHALSAATVRLRRPPAILLSFTNIDAAQAAAEVQRLAAAARSVKILE
jgi:GntR family transcriptional regulator / MocR family aminotransferase